MRTKGNGPYVLHLALQRVEIFFDLPSPGPFSNLAFESILRALLFDPVLQPFEAPTEHCILAEEAFVSRWDKSGPIERTF